MKIVEFRTLDEWQSLKPLWNALVDASAAATTFLTWEWLSAWWAAYGTQDLRIITVRDATDRLVGVAALCTEDVRRYGRTFRTLKFIGDGSNDSEYLDFIIVRGFEAAVIDALLQHLRDDLDRGVVLRLSEVPALSPTLPLLKNFADGRLWHEQAVPCATVPLPAEWDAYLATLKPRFRTKVRSVLRTLESRPEIAFGFCEHRSQLERLLPALFDLHSRRWNQDGRPGVFGWDRKQQFYREVSPALLDRGALRFSWLEWKGQLLACQYGFVYGSTYLHLQEGYEPASEHWNVGLGLRAWTIREFMRSGITEYDFLGGIGRHKTDWGAGVKESLHVLLAARTQANLLFARGAEWNQRVRERVKKVLPEAVLAARAARSRKREDPAVPSAAGNGTFRRVAARLYFALGGPAASQPLRDRYQLAIAPAGRLPVSLSRRREPRGRIFCYHRVNDERDPFLPAVPLAVFEWQMRFVAKRYRVVSLDELVAHLDSDSPETVLALTFDDGYRDNYLNALPILRRYGLPATIFLATGYLDSGEPIWFERLAEAIKTTSLEFLDLEIDVPRRLWMRSQAERLKANGVLLGLLRRLPDADRLRHLGAVLTVLGDPARSRQERMLAWDDVRAMRAHDITFGGHTVTHPYLSRLSQEQAAWEVAECKRRIESELQAPVVHFAYPNGREEDFAPWHKDILRREGYHAAVSTEWGVNDRATDRMELRRSGPWEEDEAMFAYKLNWYDLVNG